MTLEADLSDVLDVETLARLRAELQAALKRRPAQEARLAGVLRALCPFSASLRSELVPAFDVMVRRSSFTRPLYAAIVRALGESELGEAQQLLARALLDEGAGGFATLSAACFSRAGALSEPLARAAVSRQAHVAFGAELARLCRGEAGGASVASIAAKLKESHRIALCLELLAPLVAARPLPKAVAPALAVLRGSERHLGRWLLLAELATRAGDSSCREEARARARSGPESARAAWAFVAWALGSDASAPSVRPTVELVARLSDRPSAHKDPTFLFRLARARAPSARSMLESLAKTQLLGAESAVRAMLHLCRDYADERYREPLREMASAAQKDGLRALAAAALCDIGERERGFEAFGLLQQSRDLGVLAWTSLAGACREPAPARELVTEAQFRRIQQGWVEC